MAFANLRSDGVVHYKECFRLQIADWYRTYSVIQGLLHSKGVKRQNSYLAMSLKKSEDRTLYIKDSVDTLFERAVKID